MATVNDDAVTMNDITKGSEAPPPSLKAGCKVKEIVLNSRHWQIIQKLPYPDRGSSVALLNERVRIPGGRQPVATIRLLLLCQRREVSRAPLLLKSLHQYNQS